MTQRSWFWDGTTVGDALGNAPYSSVIFSQFMRVLLNADRTLMGPVWGVDNELAVSGVGAASATVATGWALALGKLYQNDAALTLAVTNTGAQHNQSVVIRWTTATQVIRAAILSNTTLTQTDAVWEIELAQCQVSAAGVITAITDTRTYARAAIACVHEESQNFAAPSPPPGGWTPADWNYIASMNLTAGKWLIMASAMVGNFDGDAGIRMLKLLSSTSSAQLALGSLYYPATFVYQTITTPATVVTLTAATTIDMYLYAADNNDVLLSTAGAGDTNETTRIIAVALP